MGVAPLKKIEQLMSDSKDKVQILVKSFQSVFIKDDNGELPTILKNPSIRPLQIITNGVDKLLLNLSMAKPQSPD